MGWSVFQTRLTDVELILEVALTYLLYTIMTIDNINIYLHEHILPEMHEIFVIFLFTMLKC